MNFFIADSFTASLTKLSGEEQRLVKTTVFDFQVNPASPGHQFHKLDQSKDPNFWSVRVSGDIRLIVHRSESSLLLCYVGHHGDAYKWAERRKLETHPTTGAAQIVQLRETFRDVKVHRYVEIEQPKQPKPLLFANLSDDRLLGYGVPTEWLETVRTLDEDALLSIGGQLPAEAEEALLTLATGGTPLLSIARAAYQNPFEHPDAQRRFRTFTNLEELAEALEYPWDRWAIFLHPVQREVVDRDFSGPARVAGSAGTGKTVVALHRAVSLARRYPEGHVLLTTFSPTLAAMLRAKVRRLLSGDASIGERLEVADLNEIAKRLYESAFGKAELADDVCVADAIRAASKSVTHAFSERFLTSEWNEVVDAWQLRTWEEYRDVRRLGRKTRLPETQRTVLWSIFERMRYSLRDSNRLTYAAMLARLTEQVKQRKHPPFEFVVVDEAQDISVPQLRFLAAVGGDRANSLFFAGDLGQRIFQTPFSWKSLGVDVRGRSRILTINYRTSHQIRRQADRLLGPSISNVDGNEEDRKGTISVFNGPSPVIAVESDERAEAERVASWLNTIAGEGALPTEMGVFVRSDAELDRAKTAVSLAGLTLATTGSRPDQGTDGVTICTMHQAKGLEFKAVVVMACDDEIIPSQARIEEVADEGDLEEVYNTERHLLYVAVTRARDFLLVTSASPPSEFLDDFGRS